MVYWILIIFGPEVGFVMNCLKFSRVAPYVTYYIYLIRYKLRIAMPVKGFKSHLLGYPDFFRREMLFQPKMQPRILTSHIRYSPQVGKVMRKGTKKVGSDKSIKK